MKYLILLMMLVLAFSLVTADSVSLSGEVIDIMNEKVTTTEKVIPIYGIVTLEYDYIHIDNSSKEPKETIITGFINSTKEIDSYIDYINKTTILKEGITIENDFITKDILFDKCNVMCKQIDDDVTCDSKKDGNGDGILQSGESGFEFNIKTVNWDNLNIKIDSGSYTGLINCIVEANKGFVKSSRRK